MHQKPVIYTQIMEFSYMGPLAIEYLLSHTKYLRNMPSHTMHGIIISMTHNSGDEFAH